MPHGWSSNLLIIYQERGFLDIMQWFLIRNKGKAVASLEAIKHPTAEQWAKAFPCHKPDFAKFKSHSGDTWIVQAVQRLMTI